MFSSIGKVKYKINKKVLKIIKKNLIEGTNTFEEVFVFKKKNLIKVYSRTCDHAGGKIISKGGVHSCPNHNWIFNIEKGKYTNGIEKKKIPFKEKKNYIEIEFLEKIPNIKKSKKNSLIKIRFFNHAFLIIETDKVKFATDPWAIGPAFNNGWFLKNATKSDWIKELNSCDFIYVSHNHPDHLNKFTLSKVRKDMLFFVPNFFSKSTGNSIEALGFKNIFKANFLEEYNFNNTNLNLTVLKSGDFREDSGLYFSIGNFTTLMDVDSNSINFFRLPHVDLFASSFAGGDSGFPLMFDNYDLKSKKRILIQKKLFLKKINEKKIKKIKPKYFLAYAGFFKEKLKRDKFVIENNNKNTIQDYEKISINSNCKLLNVEQNDTYYFKNKNLIKKNNSKNFLYKDLKPEFYLNLLKNTFYTIDKKYIKDYFVNSSFNDNLILFISLTNDNFNKTEYEFSVNFSNKKIKFTNEKKVDLHKIKKEKDKKYLYIKCRKESFLNTIYNKEPWEDLVIGFQCKIYRSPNLYNTKFWFHFTNVYITQKNVRMLSECYKCEAIIQSFNNQIKSLSIEP
tara:strand:+ start:381 stop:2075 length:1695 start_codon:yes stop_codon:yes gene_type:complete